MVGPIRTESTLPIILILCIIATAFAQFRWQVTDYYDEVREKMDQVNAINCKTKQVEDLFLRRDTVPAIPHITDVDPKYPNRTNLYHVHNTALNRGFFFSFIFAYEGDRGEPGLMYYYKSQSADILGNLWVNASGVFFDQNGTYPNFYRDFFNRTLPLFGPHTYRFDDFNEPTNPHREASLFTTESTDMGAGPGTPYNSPYFKVNSWYKAWLPDRRTQKSIYHVRIKYSNVTGQFIKGEKDDYEFKFDFFGPPGPTDKTDETLGPVVWSPPYFDCGRSNKWILSASVPIVDLYPRHTEWRHLQDHKYIAVATASIDLQRVDMNQCPLGLGNEGPNYFAGTAKCKKTTYCEPLIGWGFRRGGYRCICNPGYRYPHWQRGPFMGDVIERSTRAEYEHGFDCIKIGEIKVVTAFLNKEVINPFEVEETTVTPDELFGEFRESGPNDLPPPGPYGPPEAGPYGPPQAGPYGPPQQGSYGSPQPGSYEPPQTDVYGTQLSDNYGQQQDFYGTQDQPPDYVPPQSDPFYGGGSDPYLQSDPYAQPQPDQYNDQSGSQPDQQYGSQPFETNPAYNPSDQEANTPESQRKKRQTVEKRYTAHVRQKRESSRSNNRLEYHLYQLQNVTKENCRIQRSENLKMPSDVIYGVERFYNMQMYTAVRLANFLSDYLQTIDPEEVFSERLTDMELTENQIIGEVLANVMGDDLLVGSGVFFDVNKFRSRNGLMRQFFGPYAMRTDVARTYLAVDYAGHNETYIHDPWFEKVKARWASVGDELTEFTSKIWLRSDTNGRALNPYERFPDQYFGPGIDDGMWLDPYFDCDGYLNQWVVTYSVPFFGQNILRTGLEFKGVVIVDVKLDMLDINQCPMSPYVANAFKGTDRCDQTTTECEFVPGRRFNRGGYKCNCRQGYEYPFHDPTTFYDGDIMEVEYIKMKRGFPTRFSQLVCRIGGASSVGSSAVLLLCLLLLRYVLH